MHFLFLAQLTTETLLNLSKPQPGGWCFNGLACRYAEALPLLKKTPPQRACLTAGRPQSLVWLVWLACWVAACLAPAPARAAQDLISERAWLSDPSSNLSPDQVRQMAWTTYTGRAPRGYSSATTWIRLKIEPLASDARPGDRSSHPARLVLRILPGQLDDIALFDPRRANQPPLLTGDRHDWRTSEYRSFNHNLVIAAPSEPIEVLLRLRTTSHHGIAVEALRWEDAETVDRKQQLVLGGLIAFLMMALVWAVSVWLQRPERVIGVFILQQCVAIVFALTFLGFFRVYLSDWLPATALDLLGSMVFPLAGATLLWSHWHFLREFNPPQLGMRCLKALWLLLPLGLLLMLGGKISLALHMNATVAAIGTLMMPVLVWKSQAARPEQSPRLSRRQLLLIYSLIVVTLWSAALPAIGLPIKQLWGGYGLVAYIVINSLLMAGALQVRARYAEESRRKALTALKLSRQEVALARDRAQEQEQFLAMLTHELTTPLSVASLALSKLSEASVIRARAYRAVDSMRAIIERVSLAHRLDGHSPIPLRKVVDVTALLRELRESLNDDDQTEPRIALRLEGLLPCQTDRQLLAMVLSNLMDNALKYGTGQVTVAGCAQHRGHLPGLLLTVSNAAGPSGRPDPAHLFEKYHRGQAAMSKPGTGLGLYLSALMTQRLGGELRHLPEADDVRFELWLPA